MILEHRFAHIPQDARRGRAWLANLAPLFEGTLPEGEVVPSSAFLRYHHLGEIILAVEDSPAQTLARTECLVAAQGLDHFVLRAHVGGQALITVGERSAEAGPGDLVLIDLARPIRIATPPLATVAAVVPRRILGSAERGYDAKRWHGRVLTKYDNPVAEMLSEHLVRLAVCLPAATAAQVRHLVPATLFLCRAFASGPNGGGAHVSVTSEPPTGDADPLSLIVRQHIEEHLQIVDVAELLTRFSLSRRSLYRMFATAGGVQSYIRDRRLARARRNLARPRTERRLKLAQLAHECGFSDPRVFSRAFRRRYGVSPVAVEPGPIGLIVPLAETGLIGWLQDL